jgi:hypothetical protein
MSLETDKSNIIQAAPTKELFIFMLTRDLLLTDAILDLVDNAVDGIKNLGKDNFEGYWIRVEFKKDSFSISDNCGGISIEIAQNYAFRFGRPKQAALTPGSIGKFGIGMKRAFFKMGNIFRVESQTASSRFIIDQNVKEWIQEPSNWQFRFSEKEENLENISSNKIGTKITVCDLFENVSNSFILENFKNTLKSEIEKKHSVAIDNGLAITINGIPIGKQILSLLCSDRLKPAYFEKSYKNFGDSEVNVKIYAGISERSFEKAGWYVFCNGRLILDADQTEKTTWGRANNNPKYHPIYAYFRGYVFFDSDDAELLPWTTTKTSIDTDSSLYKLVKQEMMSIINPILVFLKQLDTERDQFEKEEIEENLQKKSVDTAKAISYQEIQKQSIFSAPKSVQKVKRPRTGRIQYIKPVEEIEKMKKILKVYTAKAVGEKTYEYFVKMECEE